MSLTHLLRREGGFVDHPADRGGATNFGITAATLGDWRGLGRPASREEVKALTEREARAIYMKRYLTDTRIGEIKNAKLRDLLLDCAVHHGPARATKWLQEAVVVTADGKCGPKTLEAVNGVRRGRSRTGRSHRPAYATILAKRIVFLGELITNDPRQAVFAKGWMRRVAEFL
jgi:lysozyme family protein